MTASARADILRGSSSSAGSPTAIRPPATTLLEVWRCVVGHVRKIDLTTIPDLVIIIFAARTAAAAAAAAWMGKRPASSPRCKRPLIVYCTYDRSLHYGSRQKPAPGQAIIFGCGHMCGKKLATAVRAQANTGLFEEVGGACTDSRRARRTLDRLPDWSRDRFIDLSDAADVVARSSSKKEVSGWLSEDLLVTSLCISI